MAILDIRTDGDGALSELVGGANAEQLAEMRARGEVIDLGDDDTIMLTGLPHGMQSGAPSVMLAFKLPDGKIVMAQTSWRLFATGFHQLAGRFNTPYPDLTGMDLLVEATGTATEIIGDDELQWMSCGVCGKREEFAPQSEGTQPMVGMWWLHDHIRDEHPEVYAAKGGVGCGIAKCADDEHHWVENRDKSVLKWDEICDKCGAGR